MLDFGARPGMIGVCIGESHVAEVYFLGKDPHMLQKARFAVAALVLAALVAGSASAADLSTSLKKGTPELKSAGPLAFGPEGILFVGDTQSAAIFAIDTGDRSPSSAAGPLKVEGLDGKIAGMLGTTEKEILINALAVNPASGNAYLSISRGKGPDAMPAIMKVDREGKLDEFALKDVKYSKAVLPNPAKGRSRQESITHLAYLDGKVYVSGLSNEEFSSRFRAISFPFAEVTPGTNVEIYHGSHGKLETKSPIRTFAPYSVNGESYILAAYTCTPLVKIPVSQLVPGEQVKGTTIAELGNHNRPLDMIVYQKEGKDYILMANNSRGLMKISAENIDKAEAIKTPIKETAGLPYEKITGVKGVEHLDRFDKENALVLLRNENGLSLQTLNLP